MDIITLGRSDLRVSKVCLGTMTFGEQNTAAEGHAQLDLALAHGVNFIDTAEMYPVKSREETYGETERIVGQWLAKRPGVRERIVLATKVAGPARNMAWIRGGSSDVTAPQIIQACEDSLKRLGTDHIDLYQMHWPNRNAPIFGQLYFDPARDRERATMHEQLQAFDQLVRAGKIRYLGLSNETPYGVAEFVRLAEQHGLPRAVSVQNPYSLLNRSAENGLDEALYRYQVGLLAYSPLAFGRLTMKYEGGGYDADGKPVGRITHFSPDWSPRYMREEVIEASRRYAQIAADHGLSATQLALAFCYRKRVVDSTIIGATTLQQLQENLDAYAVPLSDDVMQAIDAVRFVMRDPAQ